jgi:hypothetical protein
MTADSRFGPLSIVIVWPAARPLTLPTLMFVAPAAAGEASEVAAIVRWVASGTAATVLLPLGDTPGSEITSPGLKNAVEATVRTFDAAVAAVVDVWAGQAFEPGEFWLNSLRL